MHGDPTILTHVPPGVVTDLTRIVHLTGRERDDLITEYLQAGIRRQQQEPCPNCNTPDRPHDHCTAFDCLTRKCCLPPPPNAAQRIGARIKEARQEARPHIGSIDMSNLLGMSQGNYSKIELGQRTAYLQDIVRIARILRTTPAQLLGGDAAHVVPRGSTRWSKADRRIGDREKGPHT